MNNPIGSIWRKWDLHVHSPFSVLNFGDLGNGFDNENLDEIMDKYIHNLFSKAITSKTATIGITDYFLIDGYKYVKSVLNNSSRMRRIFSEELKEDIKYIEKISKILIVPNIEFRLNLAFTERTRNGLKNSKYQIHVIFSNCLEIQKIEDNFLHQLIFTKDINDGVETKYSLTKENLINFGRNLKTRTLGGDGSDLFVGMNNAYVELSGILKLLNNPEFKNNHIIVLAEESQSGQDWNNQLAGIRSEMYIACNALFSSNEKTITWGTDGSTIQILDKLMPCLWGSDAHEVEKMFAPDMNRFTWIKADPTFEGLLISLKNPKNRIQIGESVKELEYFNQRARFTLKNVKVNLKNKEVKSKVWFNIDVNLNPFMVTVIGNKGAGKSAFSDILGCLGNSYNVKYFSFLNNERFLNKKTKYGALYNAELKLWRVEESVNKELTNEIDYEKNELVKYLPQKYIEEVCNDLGDSFKKEINDSIFSYISTQERENSTDLLDLVDKKVKSNINIQRDLRMSIEKINIEIRKLEDKSTFIYRQEISNKLNIQNAKYENHITLKPDIVLKPTDELKNINSDLITKLNNLVSKIDEEIETSIINLTSINNKISAINGFNEDVDRLRTNTSLINNEYLKLVEFIEIEKNEYITFKLNDSTLKSKYSDLIEEKKILNELLDDSNVILGNCILPNFEINEINVIEYIGELKSLYDKKSTLSICIDKLSKEISIEEQNYLTYLSKYKNWDFMLKMIEGKIPNTYDGESILKYKNEILYLDQKLHLDLNELYINRLNLVNQILDEYEKIIVKYRDVYAPIQDKINMVMNANIEKIDFEASIKVNQTKLIESIVLQVDTRAGGDFRGKSEAYREVENLISSTDFNSRDSILEFINVLLHKTSSNPNEIKKILTDPLNFYNFLTKLEYLNPEYSIVSSGRDLSELSPGERGIVLLVFYLALSKDNTPLIIDQPEDNLDNQSVYSRLVPAIIEAKKNRQVILVTHNPNIAIACDSEEVIYCSINKETGELIYESGSIENPTIKNHIINVLEGTKPAFNKRRITYD